MSDYLFGGILYLGLGLMIGSVLALTSDLDEEQQISLMVFSLLMWPLFIPMWWEGEL